MSNIIKFIRGAEADIPVLNQGEPAFTTDTHKVFIGDGAENHQLAMITDTQNKLNWVYPQDYATGIGTIGDPWAGDCLNDAYTACPAGGTIYLRAGYYALGTSLGLTKQVNIVGEGINNTFIILGMTTTKGIVVANDYCTLKGFTVDGASQVDETANIAVVEVYQCDHSLVEDVEVLNGGYYGINVYECNYSTFHNVYTHANWWEGIHSGTDTAGKNMYNTYRDIYCWDGLSCGFTDRGSSAGNEETNNIYDNIHAWDNAKYGISIAYLNNSVMTNCFATGNGTRGLQIYHADNIDVVNTIVKNNNATDAANINGIHVEGCNGIKFSNCQSYDDRGTMFQRFGMGIYTSTNVSIVNCKLTPNLYGAIYDDGNGVTTTFTGIVNDYEAVEGDLVYFNGTNWVRLAKGTAGQVLEMNAGATAPEWDTLTETDITDLGAYLESLVEDTSPELGGELDCGAHSVGFTIQTATGDGTTTIDWKLGNYMKFTHGAMAETFTFTAPSNPCGLTLQIKQDGVGGRDITLPAAVKWLGTEPTWTDGGAAKTIIISMRYDGTNYWAQATSWEA